MNKLLKKLAEQTDKNRIPAAGKILAAKNLQKTSKQQYIFTVSQAAKFLGVSADTLRNWEQQRKFIPQRTKGGSRRYKLQELKKLLAHKNPYLAQQLKDLTAQRTAVRQIIKPNPISFQHYFVKPVIASVVLNLVLISLLVIKPAVTTVNQQEDQVLGVATQSKPSLITSLLSPVESFFQSVFKTPILQPVPTPSPQINQLADLSERVSQLEQQVIQPSPSPATTTYHQPTFTGGTTTETTSTTTTVSSLAKGTKYVDLIGMTIIDSEGKVYPSNSALALSDKPTLGTNDKRFYGIYSNRFELNNDGNLKVFGKTILGDTSADTVKFGGWIDSDIVPYGNDNNILGKSGYAFKSAQITTVNSSTVNTTTLTTSGNVGIGGTATISSAICLNGECKSSWSGSGNYTASNGITLDSFDFQLGGRLTRNTAIDINSKSFGFLGGNVGIGVTAAEHKLAVVGSIATVAQQIGSSNQQMVLQTANLTDTNWGIVQLSGENGTFGGIGARISTLATEGFSIINTDDDYKFVVDGSAGNVGIGNSNPLASLHIVNTAAQDSFRVDDVANDTSPFVIDLGGNVGIGTASPANNKLYVTSSNIASSISTENLAGGYPLETWSSGDNAAGGLFSASSSSGDGTGIVVNPQSSANLNNLYGIYAYSTAGAGTTVTNNYAYYAFNPDGSGSIVNNYGLYIQDQTKGSENYAVYTAGTAKSYFGGNVGIGTTSPAQQFHLYLSTASNIALVENGLTIGAAQVQVKNDGGKNANLIIYGSGFAGTYAGVTRANLAVLRSDATNGLVINTEAASPLIFATNSTEVMRVTSGGNVGIGFTSPSASLHVVNTAAQNSFRVDDVANDSSPFVVDSGGNVGIGTASPEMNLNIIGAGTALGGTSYINFQNIQDRTNYRGINLGYDSSGQIGIVSAAGVSASQLALYTRGSTGGHAERVRIDSNGNVGIGFTSPSASLHVVNTAAQNSFRVDDVANDSSPFVVDSEGNVGVGTASPGVKLEVSGDVLFAGGTQSYKISKRSNTNLTFQGQNSGTASKYEFYAEDGDTTDDLDLALFGAGTPSDITNRESLIMKWDATVSQYKLFTTSSGSGTNRALNIYAGDSNFGQLFVNTTGNIGIGTTGPGQKLEINGNTLISAVNNWVGWGENDSLTKDGTNSIMTLRADTGLALIIDSSNNETNQIFRVMKDSADPESATELFRIQENGYVGIGVSAAGANLQVNGGGLFGWGTASVAAPSNGLAIAGRLGIGTTSPAAPLDIPTSVSGAHMILGNKGDGGRINFRRPSDGVNYAYFGYNATSSVFEMNTWSGGGELRLNQYGSADSGPIGITFYTGIDKERMRINGNGNVGIGTASPASKLGVAGNVGIGTTSPARSLHTTGSVRIGPLITGGGSAVAVYRDANGDLADETSSIKFKTDITPYESVLSKVMDLEAVSFKWNDLTPTPGVDDFGMIAENVNTIIPDLVIYNDDGTPRGLRYEKMGLIALKAIQEQQGEISEIRNQVVGISIDLESGVVIIPQVKTDQIALTSNLGNISLSYDGSNIVYTGGEVSNQLLAISSPDFVNLTNKVNNLENQMLTVSETVTSNSAQLASISEQIASLSAQLALSELEVSQSASSSGDLADQSFDIQSVDDLNLTPPDILLASGSATLANLTVTSEATFSGQLLAYEATIQSTFKSLGQAFLGNTSIAGDLNVDGGLSITGDSISNLGVLYIQNSLLAQGVDFFNGKVTVDNQGKLSIQKLEVSSKTLGTVTIPAGQLELVVSSDQLTNKSKVFATPDKPAVLGVSKDVINSNFTIKLDQVLSNDLKIDWWIVDQAEN